MADPFRAMQRIHLGVPGRAGEYDSYPSMVLDSEEGRTVKVVVPMVGGREILARPETPVRLDVPDGRAVMRYHTTVIARTGAPLGLSLRWPAAAERVQRRDGFRVETRLPAEFRVAARAGDPAKRGRGTKMDLSAAGVRLRLEEALPAGTVLEVTLRLGPETMLEVAGRVVRSGTVSGVTAAERYWNGIAFQRTTERTSREITRFVMEEQRAQLRRGVP